MRVFAKEKYLVRNANSTAINIDVQYLKSVELRAGDLVGVLVFNLNDRHHRQLFTEIKQKI